MYYCNLPGKVHDEGDTMIPTSRASRSLLFWRIVSITLIILSVATITVYISKIIPNKTFYVGGISLILALLAFSIGVSLHLYILYIKRNDQLRTQVEAIMKQEMKNGEKISYMHKLFDSHFKTTDQTILDLRKERDEWKSRALKKSSA